MKRRTFLKGIMGLIPATFIAGKTQLSFPVATFTAKLVSPSKPPEVHNEEGHGSPSSSISPSDEAEEE